MANEEHLKILRHGVEVWNQWRKDNPEIEPDLSDAELPWMVLDNAYLRETDLNGANLSSASLRRADIIAADLTRAKLIGANLEQF
jgi:uncharacterized protein YjbI with pentapeptide repeats